MLKDRAPLGGRESFRCFRGPQPLMETTIQGNHPTPVMRQICHLTPPLTSNYTHGAAVETVSKRPLLKPELIQYQIKGVRAPVTRQAIILT